jgi:hypothetical protein
VHPRAFYRTHGPDLTGLFLHDAGALGIKVRASLRLMRAPAATRALSFAFPDLASAAAALCEIARAEVAEEAYVFDPETTRRNLAAGTTADDLRVLGRVMAAERGLVAGLRAGARLVAAGRDFVPAASHSLHLVCAGRTPAAVEADAELARTTLVQGGGVELPNSIPVAARAQPFPEPDGVLGPEGDRWIALNAKVAHSDALPLVRDTEALLAAWGERLAAHHVRVSTLLTAVGNHAFSYEPVIRWFDEWLPLHERLPRREVLARFARPAADPGARACVAALREEFVALFGRYGAASNQIGRTYPYVDALDPATAAFARGLKHLADPRGLMNPGALPGL